MSLWILVSAVTACETLTLVVIDVATVAISPAGVTLLEGESSSLQAQPTGPEGERLQGRAVSWVSDSPGIVTVDGGGNLTAVSAGQTTVRATADGVTGSALIAVLPGQSIELSTRDVALTAVEGGASATADIGISNGGNGVLDGLALQVDYPPSSPVGWVNAGLNGTTAPTSLTVSASAAGLAAGAYAATVVITSPLRGGLSETLAVQLTVTPAPPRIVLTPSEVAFGAVQNGQQPAEQMIAVTNGGSGVLTGLSTQIVYAPGQVVGWLQAMLTSGTAPTTLMLSASPGGLAPQTYNATVIVTADAADNSPLSLPVTFTVAPASSIGPAALPAGVDGGDPSAQGVAIRLDLATPMEPEAGQPVATGPGGLG